MGLECVHEVKSKWQFSLKDHVYYFVDLYVSNQEDKYDKLKNQTTIPKCPHTG